MENAWPDLEPDADRSMGKGTLLGEVRPEAVLAEVVAGVATKYNGRLAGLLSDRRGENGGRTYTIAVRSTETRHTEDLFDIVTKSGGFPTALAFAESPGTLVEAKNPEELTQALRRMLSSQNVKATLERLARSRQAA